MKTNDTRILLRFSEFAFPPEEITRILATVPERSGLQGEQHAVGTKRQVMQVWPSNHWEYQIPVATALSIDVHVAGLQTFLSAHRDQILDLATRCHCEVAVVIYYYEGCNPGIHLDKEVTELIGMLGLELDVDIYCLGEKE